MRAGPGERTLAGFENHAGRTFLDEGAEPLGRVVAGFGNDGASGDEGCRAGPRLGTYLHGPLLPRNPWFADRLLAEALAHATGGEPRALEPLATSSRPRRTRVVGAPRARSAAALARLRLERPSATRPERAEVDGRVARLPALRGSA